MTQGFLSANASLYIIQVKKKFVFSTNDGEKEEVLDGIKIFSS